ncbi:MAG: fasciclin domain-containing protein [Bacteroidaceae bacterium]|nr:fasciclin domain-containing protein [Bacteroidaceae bacterium]
MKRVYGKLLTAILFISLCWSCTEEIDTSARYVFTSDCVLSYLEKHDAYSEYVRLMRITPISKRSTSTIGQLMEARGHYTVFAPTNEAIAQYLQELYEKDPTLLSAPSFDAFYDTHKRDSIYKVIVANSIIDSGDDEEAFLTADFPRENGTEFPRNNMNDRKLSVRRVGVDSIYINNTCPVNVIERDILVTNGIIHRVERVIAPEDVTAAMYLQDVLDKQQEGFLVMAKAIQACGLMDTLSKIRDEVYEDLYLQGKIPESVDLYIDGHHHSTSGFKANWTPHHRNYGFTIFAEPDAFWREQGLDPTAPSATLLPQLVQWIITNHQYSDADIYTTDEHYDKEENLLYQWTTYHILPFRTPADRLVFHRNEFGYSSATQTFTIPMYEIYSTMGKRRLIKIYESRESNGIYLNRFPNLETNRTEVLHELSCDPDKEGCFVDRDPNKAVLNDIINCCIYPIGAPLSYNDNVRNNLAKQRLRFDGMTLFPEAMNNDIRLRPSTDQKYQDVYIPKTSIYNYFENMQMNNTTTFIYLNAHTYNWCNLHSDEMKAKGRFELTFKLPPIPRRGTYELRYKVLPNGDRGIQQFYFGDDPTRLPAAGIPVNLTQGISTMNVGWEQDGQDEDYNIEVDKRLRNNGVMKGAQSVTADGANDIERRRTSNLRYIIVRQTLDPDKTYYMKVKSVLDSEEKEFYMDYMEFCPKEVYDNPEKPEDIW